MNWSTYAYNNITLYTICDWQITLINPPLPVKSCKSTRQESPSEPVQRRLLPDVKQLGNHRDSTLWLRLFGQLMTQTTDPKQTFSNKKVHKLFALLT